MWQNIASVLRRVPKIVFYVPFAYLPFHEPFVDIWIERLDLLYDVFLNNGLVFRTPPDQFKTIYPFPVIKLELLFFLKAHEGSFICSHVGTF